MRNNNDNFNNNNDNGSPRRYRLSPVRDYKYYAKGQMENFQPEGFDFDVDQFENLIDAWTPPETICTLLETTEKDLNRFCQICYGRDFLSTYAILSGLTNVFMTKSLKGLAKAGNATAISLLAKRYMGFSEDDSTSNVNVTFMNDLKKEDENKC